MTARAISTNPRWRFLWLVGMALLPSTTAFAASITARSVTAPVGEGVTVDISLAPESGEQVAGMQFDLHYPAPVASLIEISPGPSATQSAKLVSSNPLGAGRHRVIVAGLNQSPIPAGTVVLLKFQLSSTAPPGNHPLTLAGVVLSDPGGRRVPATIQNGALLVPGSPGPPPPSGCACNTVEPEEASTASGDALLFALLALSCLAGKRIGEPCRHKGGIVA